MVKIAKLLSIPTRSRGRLLVTNSSRRRWRLQSQCCQFPLSRKRLFASAPSATTSSGGDSVSDGSARSAELASRSANMQRYNYFYQGLHATIANKIGDLTRGKPSLEIIDIACGNADCSEYLLEHKDECLNKAELTILGLDNSRARLTHAYDRLIAAGKMNLLGDGSDGRAIRFKLADAYNIGLLYEGMFDLGIANFVYNYCSNTDDLFLMLRSSYESLKKNGFIIGVLPVIRDETMLQELQTQQSKDELRDAFGWVHEWRKQPGDSYMSQSEVKDLPLMWSVRSSYDTGFKVEFYAYMKNVLDREARKAGFANGVEIVDKSEYVFVDSEYKDANEKIESQRYWTKMVQPYELFIMKK